MDENIANKVEAAKQELAILQAEIETLRAKKSIAESIRDAYATELPIKMLKRKVRKPLGRSAESIAEVTLLESDYLRLMEMAQASAWIEQKLKELKHLGDKLWYRLNQSTILQDAIHRAETAEIRCRSLEQQLSQVIVADYDLDDGADRELTEQAYDDREF